MVGEGLFRLGGGKGGGDLAVASDGETEQEMEISRIRGPPAPGQLTGGERLFLPFAFRLCEDEYMTHDANRRAARIRQTWSLTLVGGLMVASAVAITAQDKRAQEKPAPPKVVSSDPRVGLKAGVKDAGQVARNIELIGHLDKPEPFTDPAGSLNFANSDLAFKGHQLFLGNFHGLNFYDIEDPRKPKLTVSMPCPEGAREMSVCRDLLCLWLARRRGGVLSGARRV